jgi:hypothetical protein
MSTPTRRTFLQTAVAAATSLLLPKTVRAGGNFWFLHAPTGESWAVEDPVAWSLENAGQPVLARARERLLTLDAADPQRVIRLVARRCRLNLLELRSGRVPTALAPLSRRASRSQEAPTFTKPISFP